MKLMINNICIIKIFSNIYFIGLFFFINHSILVADSKKANPEKKLFELLGVPENTSFDQKFFDVLIKKLDEFDIEEDELIDGYEFMGGSKELKNYIKNNAKRLVLLMGGDLGGQQGRIDKVEDKKGKNKPIEQKYLFEKFEKIESLEHKSNKLVKDKPGLYSLGGYYSYPVFLAQTMNIYNNSIQIYGLNIVTPLKLKSIGKILDFIILSKKRLFNPKLIFEARRYYFEKIISDSNKEIFGGSWYWFVGLYDQIKLFNNGFYFSSMIGNTHYNKPGLLFCNGIQIPIKTFSGSFKLYLVTKIGLFQKPEGDYTGWVDSGISFRYHISTKKNY